MELQLLETARGGDGTMTTLHEIEQFLRDHPDISFPSRPASDALIDRAEKYLAVTFPDAYRQFLQHWGTLSIGPLEVYGVTGDEFESSSVPNAIWYTNELRRQFGLPREFVILYDNNGYEYYLLDTSDREGRVVVWDVSSRKVVSVKAPSLFDFILTEAKNIDL